jgi:hypothetical protein
MRYDLNVLRPWLRMTLSSALWDAYQAAQRGFRYADSSKGKQNKTTLAATFWGNRAKKFFQTVLKANNSQQFIDQIHASNNYGCIVEGVFVTTDSELTVIHVEILLKTESVKNPTIEVKIDPPTPVGGLSVMGFNNVALEFLGTPQSPRAKGAFLQWEASIPNGLTDTQKEERFGIQIVQWTIDFNAAPEVGGDVNAVALDRNGVRWLSQKEYCKVAQ